MKTLKSYIQYIAEDFVEQDDAATKLEAYIKGKVKVIKGWFERNLFPNTTLISLEESMFSDKMRKNILFSFTDNVEFMFQVILAIRVEDYKEGVFDKGFLQIKKYNMNENSDGALEGPLMDIWDSNNPENNPEGAGQIDLKSFSPDFILDKISQMENKSMALGTDDESEKDTIETLPTEQPTDF
jgi:hypothetical protein